LYGRQLAEKQKLAYYYDLGERQLHHYLQKAQQSRQATLDAFAEMLETRLDNALRRAGWARTIWQARQMVVHGHIFVDEAKVDRPSYGVSPGEVISVRPRSRKLVEQAAASSETGPVADWLERDETAMEVRVLRRPALEDVRLPFEMDYSLVLEFYTR